jgi:hypothetical protein
MSNIHGIGEYRNQGDNERGRQGNNQDGGNGQVPNFLSGFMVSSGERPIPRKESFLQMLKFTFCPGMTIRYFISIISLVQLACYLICIIFTLAGGYGLNPAIFLGPSPKVY